MLFPSNAAVTSSNFGRRAHHILCHTNTSNGMSSSPTQATQQEAMKFLSLCEVHAKERNPLPRSSTHSLPCPDQSRFLDLRRRKSQAGSHSLRKSASTDVRNKGGGRDKKDHRCNSDFDVLFPTFFCLLSCLFLSQGMTEVQVPCLRQS